MQKNPATTVSPKYTEWTFALAAGQTEQVSISADFVACLAATANFTLSLDGSPHANFMAGLLYRAPQGFDKLEITNPTAGAISVTLGIGSGDLRDARLSLSGSLKTKEVAPDLFTTGAAVSAPNAAVTLLAAGNLNRRTVMINNTGSGTVYIGGNAAALAGEGLPLLAGQERGIDTTAAIYARNDTGAAIALAVAELEFTP